MAKRKRKSPGGGAFGKASSKRLLPAIPEIEDEEAPEIFRDRLGADHEQRAYVLSRKIRWLTGRPEAEVDEFFQAIRDLSLEEFLDRYDPEPVPHFQAIKHLEGRGDDDSEKALRARVAEAFAIDPDCVDAHLLLAEISIDPLAMLGHLTDAVAAGLRKHEAILEASGDGLPDASIGVFDQPYLEALQELANYQWVVGELEASAETCREMLDADPDDRMDIIPTLIAIGFQNEDLDELSTLVDSAIQPGSTSVRFAKALIAFSRALEEFPDFEPDMSSAEPFGALQSPHMREARALLHSAIEASPWAVPMVLEPRVILLRPSLVYSIGDPFDALEFARLNYLNWTAPILPSLWLVTEFVGRPMSRSCERRLRKHHREFLDALGFLDEIELPDLSGPDVNPFLNQFHEISRDIVKDMVETGESRKGRRFPR